MHDSQRIGFIVDRLTHRVPWDECFVQISAQRVSRRVHVAIGSYTLQRESVRRETMNERVRGDLPGQGTSAGR